MTDMDFQKQMGFSPEDAKRQARILEACGETPDFVIHKQVMHGFNGTLVLPEGSHVAHIGEQAGRLYVWYAFAINMPEKVNVPYAIIGTGHRFDFAFKCKMNFCSTVQMSDGLVWHVFLGDPEPV